MWKSEVRAAWQRCEGVELWGFSAIPNGSLSGVHAALSLTGIGSGVSSAQLEWSVPNWQKRRHRQGPVPEHCDHRLACQSQIPRTQPLPCPRLRRSHFSPHTVTESAFLPHQNTYRRKAICNVSAGMHFRACCVVDSLWIWSCRLCHHLHPSRFDSLLTGRRQLRVPG